MEQFADTHKRWLLPLLGILVIAPFSQEIDLAISSCFFNSDTQLFTNNAFYSFVFDYLQLPGFILFGCAMLAFGFSYLNHALKQYRPYLLALILAMILGPGLLINGVLKPGWGRPRPRQIVEFSGPAEYRSFYTPNIGVYALSDKYKSFPSGHASMGFYFFTLAVLGMRLKNRSLTIAGFSLGAILGIILGITRIAQGGHFFTDVIFAAYLTWCVALTLDWILFQQAAYERAYRKTA